MSDVDRRGAPPPSGATTARHMPPDAFQQPIGKHETYIEDVERRRFALERIKRYAGVIHYATGACPALFFPLHQLLGGTDTGPSVAPDTDLVIEGFPRSGNTFAVHAFRLAQPRPVKTADHIHVPAQVMRAARYRVPTCVLVRPPEDAVRSMMVKYPFLNPRHILRGYAGFYERCLHYREHFVVATFEEVVTDFNGVIDRINRRFGTNFHGFKRSENNVQRVFGSIDERNAHEPIDPIYGSGRPNHHKEMAKARVRLPDAPALFKRCWDVFEIYRLLACNSTSMDIDRRARDLRVPMRRLVW